MCMTEKGRDHSPRIKRSTSNFTSSRFTAWHVWQIDFSTKINNEIINGFSYYNKENKWTRSTQKLGANLPSQAIKVLQDLEENLEILNSNFSEFEDGISIYIVKINNSKIIILNNEFKHLPHGPIPASINLDEKLKKDLESRGKNLFIMRATKNETNMIFYVQFDSEISKNQTGMVLYNNNKWIQTVEFLYVNNFSLPIELMTNSKEIGGIEDIRHVHKVTSKQDGNFYKMVLKDGRSLFITWPSIRLNLLIGSIHIIKAKQEHFDFNYVPLN